MSPDIRNLATTIVFTLNVVLAVSQMTETRLHPTLIHRHRTHP